MPAPPRVGSTREQVSTGGAALRHVVPRIGDAALIREFGWAVRPRRRQRQRHDSHRRQHNFDYSFCHDTPLSIPTQPIIF